MDLGIRQWIEQCMQQNPDLAKKIIKENSIMIERMKGILAQSNDYKSARSKLLNHITNSSDPNERTILTEVYQMCLNDKTKDDELANEYKSFDKFYNQYSGVVEGQEKK